MKEVFMPAKIRNLLGISRSAIQYYRDKGLIEIKKNGHNGYSYYSGNNLLEIIDISFYRNCMNASILDIRDIIESDSPESMYSSYVDKINTFEENIRRQQEHLVMLRDFEHRIKRALSHMNTFREVPNNKKLIYIFPKSEKLPMYTQNFFLYLIGIANLF